MQPLKPIPQRIPLFPPENDTSPVSHDAPEFSLFEETLEYKAPGKKASAEPRVSATRGPRCTACSRSPWRTTFATIASCTSKGEPVPFGLEHDTPKVQPPIIVPPVEGAVDEPLYVVLSSVTVTNSHHWLIKYIRAQGWQGSIILDRAVRCGTAAAVTDTHIKACTPYTKWMIAVTGARRILVQGPPACKSTIGNTMHAWNYGSWAHVPAPSSMGGRLLVVQLPDPAEAMRNDFIKKHVARAIARVTKQAIPTGVPTDVFLERVTSPAALEAFVAWTKRVPWAAYDVEWAGVPLEDDFRLVCMSFSHPDHLRVWSIDDSVFDLVPSDGWPDVRATLREVLRNLPVVAQNVAAEYIASQLEFDVELGHVAGDTMLAFKLLSPDAMAGLEALAYYIGYNSHKSEMKDAEVEALERYLTAHGLEKFHTTRGGESFKSHSMGWADREVVLRYNGLDTYITGELHVEAERRMKLKGVEFLHKTLHTHELKAAELCHRVHVNGFAVDRAALALSQRKIGDEVAMMADRLHTSIGADPGSVAGLRDYLEREQMYRRLEEHMSMGFDGKQLDPKTVSMKLQKYKTGSGLYSTNATTIKTLKKLTEDEALGYLTEWREVSKLYQAYGKTLHSFIRSKTGRVHPQYRMGATRTGRLSTSGPSIHQIPKHGVWATFIKSCFVAPHSSTLVAFDYKTLEVFEAAIQSGDEAMRAACLSSDFHTETAKKMAALAPQLWGMTPEEVEAEIKAGDKSKRTAAKSITFSVMYGAGAFAIADTLRCTVEEAQDLLQAYFRAYPQFKEWVDRQHMTARTHGRVVTQWQGTPFRVVPLLDAGYTAYDDKSRMNRALRQAQNAPIQGAAAQYGIKAAMDLEDRFRKERVPAKIVAMVHDSIVVEANRRVVADVVPMIYNAMVGVPTGSDMRLHVDAEIGDTWGNMEDLDLFPYVGAKS